MQWYSVMWCLMEPEQSKFVQLEHTLQNSKISA
jgi:hypothetical protein